MVKNELVKPLLILYSLVFFLYSLYSYSQIDLNLTLSSNALYQSFQKLMINLGYYNRPFSALIYSLIIIALFTLYFLLFNFFKKKTFSVKSLWWLIVLIVMILLFSYPALSHDIFNYIFNAKMVLFYHKNPHINVALEFPNDLWIRFMHNTHTPAPYFYGWTIISLVPALLGFGKLVLNILSFKMFQILFFAWQFILLKKILTKLLPEKVNIRLLLFILNPLLLIEVFGNGHNDLSMTCLALLSLWFLVRNENKKPIDLILSLSLLVLSVSIKYVTIVLLPLYVLYYFYRKLDIGFLGALFLFLTIFTRPQDQFQSWYLIWSLSFAVLAKKDWILKILLFFSFSLMIRYVPFLYVGEFTKSVMESRTMITYLIPIFLLGIYFLWSKISGRKTRD